MESCLQSDFSRSRYGADHTSELKIAGRIVLNAWRVFRHEMSCYSYTFENMMFHILHERVPKFEFCTLTAWWCHPSAVFRCEEESVER